MHDVYCNQRIQKQASCPPWASIQLHGLFAHRSHKSHDTPSCRPWEAGVGTGSELWQAVPSLPEPLSRLPSQPAVGTADSAPGTCKPASPSPTKYPWEEAPPFSPEAQALDRRGPGALGTGCFLLWWGSRGLEPGSGTPRIQTLSLPPPCSPGREGRGCVSTSPPGGHR